MNPLDHPYPGRPHRVYLAITNHCNRACPWCSTYSSPKGTRFLDPQALPGLLPDGPFEAQLEGGEPTLHPAFWTWVERLRANPRCQRLVVCTNGLALPRQPARLAPWLERLGAPLTLKLSINQYLLERDAGLVALAVSMGELLQRPGGDRQLVINARYRPGEEDPAGLTSRLAAAGLGERVNCFPLQRYGLARNQVNWEPPLLAGTDFRLVNPDGSQWGTDLVARSEAMGRLP
jgi:hypothetical protein